ncbi:MAG: hypothetical protein ACLGJA_25330, partial [Gammaproteobacteria bacterium]
MVLGAQQAAKGVVVDLVAQVVQIALAQVKVADALDELVAEALNVGSLDIGLLGDAPPLFLGA